MAIAWDYGQRHKRLVYLMTSVSKELRVLFEASQLCHHIQYVVVTEQFFWGSERERETNMRARPCRLEMQKKKFGFFFFGLERETRARATVST